MDTEESNRLFWLAFRESSRVLFHWEDLLRSVGHPQANAIANHMAWRAFRKEYAEVEAASLQQDK